MTTLRATDQTPGRRRQSEAKRAAVLDAAEALFVAEGYEVASVDAIAARAGVSKRTVYDHFGDKQHLFAAVLDRSGETLIATIRAAIDEELTADRDVREALLAFARRIATETFPMSAYAVFRRLNAQAPLALPSGKTWREEREAMLEERFARFADDGELRITDPHRAVQHFVALTLRLALDAIDQGADDTAEVLAIITDGVDAFLRAYR
ncbi:TetR/AcrR family transcriptional regulator [Glycomyces artemisiae]|uniref:TetR family transcriptional regulator n=1 Tax=Glycomyces artemisiae TaxID=1076443 RepID=A0A2T0UPL8_9ACTN|nr:TetR/AcrR family transcriptional regulator [Glycomyces artemisiae]PRY59854.1 TetR family transcriptional regulator [Glycomyces artemisiae]